MVPTATHVAYLTSLLAVGAFEVILDRLDTRCGHVMASGDGVQLVPIDADDHDQSQECKVSIVEVNIQWHGYPLFMSLVWYQYQLELDDFELLLIALGALLDLNHPVIGRHAATTVLSEEGSGTLWCGPHLGEVATTDMYRFEVRGATRMGLWDVLIGALDAYHPRFPEHPFARYWHGSPRSERDLSNLELDVRVLFLELELGH